MQKIACKMSKKIEFYFGIFLSFRNLNLNLSQILMYDSVKSLFLARLCESMEGYSYHIVLGIGFTL